MKLDGEEIQVGDWMFDVVFGHGVVEHIDPKTNTFLVLYGNRRYNYTETGRSNFPQRTLYWKDPIQGFFFFFYEVKWDYFCKLRKAVADITRQDKGV